jgi:glycerophosphoryl diester phosphodiesterase
MFFKPDENYPLNIAHRGARSLAPENTLLAGWKAVSSGADIWEIDVQLTSDEIPVVIHDDTLSRTSDIQKADAFAPRHPWFVYDFTLSELRVLDFGAWFAAADPFGQIAAGAVSGEDLMDFKDQPIPTLWDALVYANQGNLRINIEIKALDHAPGNAVIVKKVVELVEDLNMAADVLISSFKYDYLRQVKALNPGISIAVLAESPHPDPLKLIRDLGAEAYHPRSNAIYPEDVGPLRKAGIFVNVWTLNDEPSIMKFIKAGVSGIFTDFPQLLTKIKKQIRPARF